MPYGDPRPCYCGPWWSVVPPPPCPVHSPPCCQLRTPGAFPIALPGFDLADYAKRLRELADSIDPNKEQK